MHGGMDTTAGIIEDFENYVNIPLLIDEVESDGEDRIKSIIKSVYGQTCRKKFRHKNNINTTLFFNTNNYFLYGTEYKNRCIELNFKQNDFNCHEAEKFNKFQDFLSFISAYIIQNTEYTWIKHSIKQADTSELLSKLKDNRIKRNLANAVTGLTLLIKLINSEDFTFEMFEERLADYIKEINNIADNEIEKFITVLKELLDERYGKLRKDEDYLIYDDGIHVLTGNAYGKFSTHFKNTFARLIKNEKPLDMKKYYDLLKNSGAEMKNVYYSRYKQTRYGLYLSFQSFNELAYQADNSESYTYNSKNVENDTLISPCAF